MALRDVLEQVRLDISDGHADGANEQEAKEWFITPILQALGWRGPGRVRLEHPAGRERVKMDFALQGPDRKSVALIEAKVPGSDLSSHVGQVLNYAFYEGVDICVLTTGVEWWLYLPRERGDPPTRRFAELDVRSGDIDDLESTLMSCLGYEALTSGEAEQHARTILAARQDEKRLLTEIPRVWRQMVDEPDRDLVQFVADRVFRAVRLRPTADQIAAVLRGDTPPPAPTLPPVPPLVVPRPSRRGSTSIKAAAMDYLQSRAPDSVHINDILTHLQSLDRAPTGQSPRVSLNTTLYRIAKDGEIEAVGGGFWRATRARLDIEPSTPERRRRRTPRRITGYRLWRVDHETNTWKGMLGGVAAEVYRKHPDEFHRAFSLRGHSRQYVATTADNMRQPVAIPDSQYFVETHAGEIQATQLARQLLTISGYEADDLEILYEQ